MNFVNQEIANPKRGRKREDGGMPRAITLGNINEDADIFKVGENDMPFQGNLQVWELTQLRPKSGPPQCDPHGSLGYKSKCWATFDSQFDMLMNHIGANE